MKTVLIADDTEFVRERFRAALEAAGHRAMTVGTGPELLAAMRRQTPPFDLIVMDLRLPHSHGVQLLRAARQIHPQQTMVIFSGTIASADEVRALAAMGIEGYVNEYTAVQHIVPSLTPHLSPGRQNRRSSPRVVLGISITYRFRNTIATALTLNVSHGGIAVRTASPLAAGAELRARFRLPGGKREIDAAARVAWTDRRVGMGLQFTNIDAASQHAIDEFVQSHFFSNRKA